MTGDDLKENRTEIIFASMGDSLMAKQRVLAPSILVRIQVSQLNHSN